VASHARRDGERRKRAEREAGERATVATTERGFDDIASVVHEEVERLHERYRIPVVLCDLEGQTHEEAARAMRCPVGTVKSRLARGRGFLRGRLVRRGLAPTSVLLALDTYRLSAQACVPPFLPETTFRIAPQFAPG
jgi:DNA-directed RNA polymerase specialized sigma24 family protein